MRKGPIECDGITFLFVTQEEDTSNGPYYQFSEFPSIKIYPPQSSINSSHEWLTMDVDTGKDWQGEKKANAFRIAANWIKQKEQERQKLSQNKTTEK